MKNREKICREKKMNRASGMCGATPGGLKFMSSESQKKKKKNTEKIFEK